VGHFGREALVQVAFYTKSEEWDTYAEPRDEILRSFRFAPGKEYSVALAALQPTSSLWFTIGSSAMTGAIVGGISGGLWVLMRSRRKHDESAGSNKS